MQPLLKGIKPIKIPFPKDLYGEEIARTLLPAVGYACNVLDIVSEMLINASVVGDNGELFQIRYKDIRDEETHERVVEDLCSGEWFKTTDAEVKQLHGISEDSTLLGLVFSYDAASVNLKTGSTATPLYVSVGNVSQNDIARNSENVGFVGFFPKHTVDQVCQR